MSNRDAENTTGGNGAGGEDDVSGYGITPPLMIQPVPPPEQEKIYPVNDVQDLRTDPPPAGDPPRMPPGVEGEKDKPTNW